MEDLANSVFFHFSSKLESTLQVPNSSKALTALTTLDETEIPSKKSFFRGDRAGVVQVNHQESKELEMMVRQYIFFCISLDVERR